MLDNPAKLCLTCNTELAGKRFKFCTHKCAMKWHNSRADWFARKDRPAKNAARKLAYETDPEFWRNKARKWRENNPEKSAAIGMRAKERYWESPWVKLVVAAKGRADTKNWAFDLTVEWAKTRWTGFCELTAIPFSPMRITGTRMFSPSIDRINPKGGYTQDNCRFVLFSVNALKADGYDDGMFLIVQALHKKWLESRTA